MASSRQRSRTLILAGAISFVVIVAGVTGLSRRVEGPVAGVLRTLTSPVAGTWRWFSDSLDFLRSVGGLAGENESLRLEVLELQSSQAQFEEVKRENELLREQLGLTQRDDLELDLAQVIGRDPGTVSRDIVIDKGFEDGVEVDTAVVIGGGVLVGRVIEVQSSVSIVRLITDSRSAVNVFVEETRTNGIVHGQAGLGLLLDTVPQNDVLNADDVLVTSGLGGVFPRGLVVGRVEAVREADNALFQEAVVAPFFTLRDLELVSLVK